MELIRKFWLLIASYFLFIIQPLNLCALTNLEIIARNTPSIDDLNTNSRYSVTSKDLPLNILQTTSQTIDLWTRPTKRFIEGRKPGGAGRGMSVGTPSRWEDVPSKKYGTTNIEIISNQPINDYKLTYSRPIVYKQGERNYLKISVDASQPVNSTTNKTLFNASLVYRCMDDNCKSAYLAAAEIQYNSGPISKQTFVRKPGSYQMIEKEDERTYASYVDEYRRFISKENYDNKVKNKNYIKDDYLSTDASNPFSKKVTELFQNNSQLLQPHSVPFTPKIINSPNKENSNSVIKPSTQSTIPFKK